ncbi:MAG: alpha/beta fold hydrolase [Mycoplasmataceae bacterium]|nr:alpha/beta fold hydrolase [Mycoplasmataceae bacterium]
MKKEKKLNTYIYRWEVKNPKAVLQLVHGSKEHIDRYEDFIKYLNKNKITVVAMDLRGHGKYSLEHNTLGNMGEGDIQKLVVDDIDKLSKIIRKDYKGVPYTVFGHSMGSFIVRRYAQRFDSADKYIFCGTNNQPKIMSIVALGIVKATKMFMGDDNDNKLLDNMSYKTFAKKFKNKEGSWMSSDVNQQPSPKDKMFGFPFDNKTFEAMLQWSNDISKTKNIKEHDDKPTLFIAGKDDPVGNFGKGVKAAQAKYSKYNKNTDIKLYDGMRHEILNEKDKSKVYEDLKTFILK